MSVSTGMKKLDGLIGGGLPENTVTLVSGGPGTGKTLFALKFLMEGCQRGERCCYISLNETPEELIRACKNIESLKDIGKYLNKNFAMEHMPFWDGNLSLKRFVDIISSYPKIDRLVLDNVNKLLIFAENRKSYRANLSKLLKHIRPMKSSIIICETRGDEIDTGNGEAFECDSVIHLSFLELEEKPMRTLTIEKMRYTLFEPKIPYEFLINEKDISLGESKVI
ncbi:MAG: DUF2075 domain-containing protein [Candidatus Aenigmarchaeota archaeon]|nr:DUF2075 domain-containing protein [Candidatus Aenigmarchaeota archaeon]